MPSISHNYDSQVVEIYSVWSNIIKLKWHTALNLKKYNDIVETLKILLQQYVWQKLLLFFYQYINSIINISVLSNVQHVQFSIKEMGEKKLINLNFAL